MISTNTVKPKENKTFDKFLQEEMIEGKPTGNIISRIPRRVITTSQESFKNRRAPAWPTVFPGVRKVDQKQTKVHSIQTQDLRKIEEQKKAAEVKTQAAAIKASKPKGKAGRKAKRRG